MENELIAMNVNKILQTRSHTAILLGTEKKQFAIYMEPSVGAHIQLYLANERPARPFSHELLQQILKGLGAKIVQVVIHECQESIYFARFFVEQEQNDKKVIIEIDARPSDCIPLAIMNNIPIYCRKEVFEKAISVQP